ncbi:toll-like receptor 13 [Mytilus galloprovincialis]|uniref:Toll-like receptor 13 n=1 Tax=Mytilus galloprovincialis TaxID=29158 RepID=A0A8B6EKC3_MYTGA|nr:toll-like receptor 13 [Mytilus galloprovincialis]
MQVASRDKIKCPIELCKCTESAAICSGKNLTYIPRFPKDVRSVTFRNGNIGTLSKERNKNLTFNVITELSFINNTIVRLEPDAFSTFIKMNALTISSEPSLSANDVMNALNNMKTTRLKYLKLTDNKWKCLPDNMFKALQANIININLDRNYLQLLNFSWFSNMSGLLILSASFNKLSTIIPDSILSLRRLYLDNNEIIKLPTFCSLNPCLNSALPNLKYLSIRKNKIENVGQFRCLSRLKTLKIDDNWIDRINYNSFTELKELTDLSLEAMGKKLNKIENGSFNIPSLQMISLRNCDFHFQSLSISEQNSMLSSCNDLIFLDISGNFLNSTILHRLLSPLKLLRHINLENTRLGYLPNNVFPELPVIETLIMRMNRIYGWGIDVFDHMPSLQYLDLSHNLIKTIVISSFPTTLLTNLKKINLGKNQFACSCEQIWFVNWIRGTNITVLGYPFRYYCTTPDNFNGVLLKDYKPSFLSCNPIFLVVISISASACLLISIVVTFLKCNINVKNYLYLLKVKQFRRQGYLPILNSDDYEYHAFVVYCDENRIWVHDDFVKKLENEEGFKFCIHHRDFDVGESISGNVDKFLKKSWKVVVIISNAFAKSEWCQWEVDIIQERRRRQGRDALLLVMLENITSKNMTSPLRGQYPAPEVQKRNR